MRGSRFTLYALAGSLLLSTGMLHTHLEKAEPAVDGTVTAAPKAIRLWFNERPEVALSGATLLRADSSPVAVVKLGATDDTLSVAGTVPVALEPGKYIVAWKTGSRDGHVVRGRYSFTYDPSASAPRP
jgi:methionine-rich copper-binding protein CopC